MSSRWYPLYQKGNPQLRIFLPNFWMKLVRGRPGQPLNIVKFIVSDGMSRYDIQNYLENIYKVPVAHVSIKNNLGEFKRAEPGGYIIKGDDYKVAYVTLPDDTEFKFPDLYPEAKVEAEKKEEEKTMEELQISFKQTKGRNKNRPDVPSWFTF